MKIFVNNIDERLAELNRPANIPLSYRAYAIYEVDKPQEVEKYIYISPEKRMPF